MARSKKTELSERDQQVIDTLEKVTYRRLNTDDSDPYTESYDDANDLTDYDGELVGVYTLSHFARVRTHPVRASLVTVDAK